MCNGADFDLPPEFTQYRDEGCDLAASCLSCPFQRCLYDQPGGRQSLLKTLRDREIGLIFHAGNKGIRELAIMFGVSTRTVQRAVKGPAAPQPTERRRDEDRRN